MLTRTFYFQQIFISLVLFYLLVSTTGSHSRNKRNIFCYLGLDHVVKGVLHDSIQDLHKQDPIRLGNSTNDRYHDGIMQGLSSLANVTELVVDCEDDSVVFRTTLGVKDAVVHYKWKYLTMDGTIWSRADDVHFDLEVKLNFTGKVNFEVVKVLVTKLEGFRFGFSGLGPINPLVKGVVKTMNKVWTTKITAKIQKHLKDALEVQLSRLTHIF